MGGSKNRSDREGERSVEKTFHNFEGGSPGAISRKLSKKFQSNIREIQRVSAMSVAIQDFGPSDTLLRRSYFM